VTGEPDWAAVIEESHAALHRYGECSRVSGEKWGTLP
jgi:hypothetical protein